MHTISTLFPGADCACCSCQPCKYYVDILSTLAATIALLLLILLTIKYMEVVSAFMLRRLQLLARATKTVAQEIVVRSRSEISYAFPLKKSIVDIKSTFKVLVCDHPIRAKFHSYEKQCDMWMDYRIIGNYLWKMTHDYNKYPEIHSIQDLWNYLDSLGDSKGYGYEKFFYCLEQSLEEFEIPSFHLGHESIVELINSDGCLLESEDYKCNKKIQRTIKENLDDFVEMTDVNELLPVMERKQLLTSYDKESLNQHSGIMKAHYLLTKLLSSKGHRGYIIYLECLEEEKKHNGHQAIAKKINAIFKECNMYCPRKYVLREIHMCHRPKGMLGSTEYFVASERLMYLCQTGDGHKLDYEIQKFILSHKRTPEAKAVGLLMQTQSFKFRNSNVKISSMEPKIKECIMQIKHAENRSIIQGNWYLIMSCWNRHLGNFQEAKTLLRKAKGELFTLASGDDRAKILYNEACLLIEENGRLGAEEERQVLTLLQDATRCFKHASEGISIMQARCQLRRAHCHIGSSLRHPRITRRPSQLEEANSILVALKKQFKFLPVRLQMEYYAVECDYYRAIGERQQATDCLQKGIKLNGSKKFDQDLNNLKIREVS